MKKLLAVFAHPDDETFICGGTFAKYAANGVEIQLICATKGEKGRRMGDPPFATRESLPQIRERELRDACRILGIERLEFLNIIDKSVAEHKNVVTRRTIEVVMEWRPDALITFTTKSGFANHEDHRAVALSALDAQREWGKQGIDVTMYGVCGRGEAKHPDDLGVRPEQIVVVDVQHFAQQKLDAYRAHRTQSELDKRIWDADEDILPYMRAPEYFIQLNGKYQNRRIDLF